MDDTRYLSTMTMQLYRGDEYKTLLAAFTYTVMTMTVEDDYTTVYMWDRCYNRCVARYDIEDN